MTRASGPAKTSSLYRVAAVLAVAGIAAFGSIAPATSSSAAPGDPFDPSVPYVFVSQQTPTVLYAAVAGSDGSITFTDPSAPFDGTYNAIGFDEDSGYIYAISQGSATTLSGALLRIGQDGVVTPVGSDTFGSAALWGTVVDGLYYAGTNSSTSFAVWDLTTGLLETKALDANPGVYDVTYSGGFFWGTNGTSIVRLDLLAASPTVDRFPFAVDAAGLHGAAWTYGNGNVAFSNNVTGLITQIRITSPGSAAPQFSILGQVSGPASSTNDGTSSVGSATDLEMTKTTTTPFVFSGDTAEYTLGIRNLGPSLSSGSIVSDVLPAALVNPTTSTPGCAFVGSTLTCSIGPLNVGESIQISYSADVAVTSGNQIDNTATVTGNERDQNLANNSDSVSLANCTNDPLQPACSPAPSLSLLKSASPSVVTAAGESVTYSFLVTNTGNLTMNDIGISETAFSGANAVPAVGCPVTVLAPLESTTCTATYVMSQADIDAGALTNSATAHGTPPGLATAIDSLPSSAGVTVNQNPGLDLEKSASVLQLNQAGQTVTYSFLITNTGNVTLTNVRVVEESFNGSGAIGPVACPGVASFAPNATLTCSATYRATSSDMTSDALVNTATARATMISGTPVTSVASSASVDLVRLPSLPLTGVADPMVLVLFSGLLVVVGVLFSTGSRLAPRATRALRKGWRC